MPSLTRVRRDTDEPGLYDVPGIGENSNAAAFDLDSPEILEQEKPNNRWHWIWKNKREAAAEGYKIPVEVKEPVRKADGAKDSGYEVPVKVKEPVRKENGAKRDSGSVHVTYSEVNWCGLAYCHYSNLDSALFALYSLLSDGIERVAVRMESSQSSAESTGRRIAEEIKTAGRQLESVVVEFANLKKIFVREGAENRDTWRELGGQLGASERATESVGSQVEEQRRGGEAALAEVAEVIRTTGDALAAGTAKIVSQISEASNTEAGVISGISQELQMVVSQMEKENNNRKKEAQISNDNLEKATIVLKNGLESGAGLLANELEALSANMSAKLHAIRSGVEGIPHQIGHLSEYMRESFSVSLAAIDNTLKNSLRETNLHLEELPNVRFDAIEATLANVNKDFTSTLEIEGEKLRSTIRELGQGQLGVRKMDREQSNEHQTVRVLEDYFKQIVEQNRVSHTDSKLQQTVDQIRDIRAELNEDKNINKLAAGNKDLWRGLTSLQQSLSRNSQIRDLGARLANLDADDKSVNTREFNALLMLLNQKPK